MLKFELNDNMIAIIGKALGAQPFDVVAPVIAELQKQINAQQKQNGRDQGIVINETPLTETPQ